MDPIPTPTEPIPTPVPPTPPKSRGCFKPFILIVSILFVFLVLVFLYLFSSFSHTPPLDILPVYPDANPSIAPELSIINSPLSIPVNVGLPSLYNDQLTFRSSEPAKISELSLILDILNQVQTTSWDGNANTPLPLTYANLDEAKLASYATSFTNQDTALDIPADLEPLYLSDLAKTEILADIFAARTEYLAYLKARGVHPAYLAEFETTTFLPDPSRLLYAPADDPTAPLTGVSPLQSDPRQLKFTLQTIDIYLPAVPIAKSGIFGPNPDPKTLRSLGLRNTAYHEFTHILQTAVDSVNTASDSKYPTISISSVSSLNYRWGNLATRDYFNASATRESQADGISYEIITSVYNLSPVQRRLYWEFMFGRLAPQAATYDQIHAIFESRYPNYDPFDLPSKIEEDIIYKAPYSDQTRALTLLLDQAELSSYAGYLHPLRDTSAFWTFSSSTHHE